MQLDNFLSKFGMKYDDLRKEERRTLAKWLQGISDKQITVKAIEDYIRSMADGVARELCSEELPKKKDIFLKARLRNYLMLCDFLTSPEKARKALEEQLKNIKGR